MVLKDVGEYYLRIDNEGLWGNNSGINDISFYVECRFSYIILMMDGIYNGNNLNVGNMDGIFGLVYINLDLEGENFNYEVVFFFVDMYLNIFVDVVMEYWKKDLWFNLDDKVFVVGIDEVFWQYMIIFIIGFGVSGIISEIDVFVVIKNGDIINWFELNISERRIDDFLYVFVNGCGGFVSV